MEREDVVALVGKVCDAHQILGPGKMTAHLSLRDASLHFTVVMHQTFEGTILPSIFSTFFASDFNPR